MRRPTGSYFWDSDLKRSIIIKPFCRTGYNFSSARKLQNIIGDLTVERGIKNLPIFENGVSLWLQIPSKRRSTFGGLGGTHPPKTYSSTPRGAASAEGCLLWTKGFQEDALLLIGDYS